MTIFKLSNIITPQQGHLLASLFVGLALLNGCQPSDSLSAADEQNNGSVDSVGSDNNTVSADNDEAFSDIAPTYVEGVADAPAKENIANSVNVSSTATACQNATVVNAFKAQQSDRQVKGCGTIIKALPDDNQGRRHQKILIELEGVHPKQTLLLVHNIDLAPRVANVSLGTPLSFYGEYVYNNKGGLVHWTHHDPAARHQGGWIESGGVRYQ